MNSTAFNTGQTGCHSSFALTRTPFTAAQTHRRRYACQHASTRCRHHTDELDRRDTSECYTRNDGSSQLASAAAAISSRRANLAALTGAVASALLLPAAASALTLSEEATQVERREAVDTTITDKVYLDIGVCATMMNQNRKVGDKSALCSDPEAIGRIVIGLYGNHLPVTTANFKRAVESGLYRGTTFHKILPGEYLQAGKQGSKRMGEVFVPKETQEPNPELLSGASYRLPHLRPGTVSLATSNNDDYPDIRQARDFRNMQFLVTTGPGPVPSLDGENIVFGRVLEGLDTVGTISKVPTFSPGESARQMNSVARFFGDERANKAKAKWGRPLKAVLITATGVL